MYIQMLKIILVVLSLIASVLTRTEEKVVACACGYSCWLLMAINGHCMVSSRSRLANASLNGIQIAPKRPIIYALEHEPTFVPHCSIS